MHKATKNLNEKDIQYKKSLKKITKFLKNNFFSITTLLALITFVIDPFKSWGFDYIDADGYMHAIRIKNWLINPSFFEQPILESNYPFGEILHITRPFDIIWILCTLPFINILSLKEAIFIGGGITAPILGIFTALALGYGLKRNFNIFIALLGIFLFLNNPHAQTIYNFIIADHHPLITTLGVLSISIIMCWFKKRQNYYLIRLSLVLSIMSLCAVDGILFSFLIILFFIYLYVFKNVSITYAYKIIKYYTIFSIILLLLNPPYHGYFHVDTGRLSILHITTFILSSIALYIIEHYHIHTKRLKITSLFLAFSSICLITILIFGKQALISPLNEELKTIFINRIFQNYSITKTQLHHIFISALIPFTSILLNIFMLLRKQSQHNRLLILNLFIGLPLFLLNFYAIRFEYFNLLYTIIPFLCLIDDIYKKSNFHRQNKGRFPLSIYILILGYLILQITSSFPLLLQEMPPKTDYLNENLLKNIEKTKGTILTDIFLSPIYVYKCDVNTVSTPYHSNTEGIIDGHKILYSTNDFDIISLLLKHQITQIVLFENYDKSYYNMNEQNKHKLYYRILKDERLPPYLEKIPSNNENIHHYKVLSL
jgi:hypothetical protein